MAKYNHVILDVKKLNNNELVTEEGNVIQKGTDYYNALDKSNVIYIYSDNEGEKKYVGQTKHFLTRHKQHCLQKDIGFGEKSEDFTKVIVLFSQYFNKSALDDVERQLIIYLKSDNNGSNTINYKNDDMITNRTEGNYVNEYKEKEDVQNNVIIPFWKDVLYPLGWVSSQTIEDLKQSVLFKYSPIKKLTENQEKIIEEILSNNKNYVINGDAGTGKTVMLTNLAARLIDENPNIKLAIVVDSNWVKMAKNIFKVYGLEKNIDIDTSTKIIKNNIKYDVILVDESHKLSRRGSKQMSSFEKVYDISEFKNCTSHLEILKRIGNRLILMYDVLQSFRPAHISQKNYAKLTKDFEQVYLKTQFRIKNIDNKSYTSEDYINGIKYLLYKDTGVLQHTNFDPNFNRDVFNDLSNDSYFGFVENNPLHELFDWIDEDLNFNPTHTNRVLAGLVEPWKISDGKDIDIKHWHEGDLHLRWNSTRENWLDSKDEDAFEQIGSVFAIQGLDLNKVGVLIGNDLQIDENGALYADVDNFYNVNGKFKKDERNLPENKYAFTLFVLNIYYILLTRGIDGIRIGFWNNDAFKDYMIKTLDIQK